VAVAAQGLLVEQSIHVSGITPPGQSKQVWFGRSQEKGLQVPTPPNEDAAAEGAAVVPVAVGTK